MEGEAAPEKAEHDSRTEGCTEYAPGVGNKLHNAACTRRIGNKQSNEGDNEYDDAACPKHFLVTGLVFADYRLVNVAGKGRSGSEQLTGSSTHGSCQYAGEQDTAHQSRENAANHGDEYQRVLVDVFIHAQIHTANNAYHGSEEADEGGPADSDNSGFLHFLLGFEGHEADDDMRHTEVAQTPAEAGDNIRGFGNRIPVIGRNAGNSLRID